MTPNARDIWPDAEEDRRLTDAPAQERLRREVYRLLKAEDRGRVSIPAIETLRDRLSRPVDPVRYRIEGLQPTLTRTVLAAQFKAGKTTLIGNIIRSYADGAEFLGHPVTPVEGGRVVLLDDEMGARQLDDWYRDLGIANTDRVCIASMRGHAASFDILDPDVRAGWAERLRALLTKILVIDCLPPLLDALGLDEHKDAGKFLVALDALIDEAEISETILVHHMGHQGERSRGDSRLRDWPDVEWRLVRETDDPGSPRYFTAYGRDVDTPESQLAYDPSTRSLSLVGGNRRDAGHRDALAAVLDAIGEAELSGRQIKTALAESEHPRSAIEGAIKLGIRTGAITVSIGARNSRLHRVSVPVSWSVPPVSRSTEKPVSQCPSAYRPRDARHSIAHRVSVPSATL
jgi:AAA domain